MKKLLLCVCILLPLYAYMQHVPQSMTAQNGQRIGFYQFTPADYDENRHEKYPLIIFLHGIGERGNGTTELNRVLANGIPKTIERGHPMRFFWNGRWQSFIVLSPQLNSGYSFWQLFYVDEMIRYAKENLNIDPNRIILTGVSLGGGGAWYWAGSAQSNSEQLAALGVTCGTCQGVNWSNVTNAVLPVWAFHAQDDNSVSVGCTTGTINELNNRNPVIKPYMTIWPNGGHAIWDRVYDTAYQWQNPNIYEWFLGQDRSLPVNSRPKANAGNDLTISLSTTTSATLSGSRSADSDGKIVRYIWTKLSGPSGGNIAVPVSEHGLTSINSLTQAGQYVYQLKVVDDRAEWSLDTVIINVVSSAVPNIPPVTQASVPSMIESSVLQLNGERTYDPDGQVVAYEWQQIEGPDQLALSDASTPVATVSQLSNGIYTFTFAATDNQGAITIDTISFTANNIILPVRFRQLRGRADKGQHIIQWTISESFEANRQVLEMSTDGVRFTPVYTVEYAETGVKTQQFEHIVKSPPSKAFYRVRAISSVSGWNELSQIITINSIHTNEVSAWEIYPNPARTKTTLQIQSAEKGVHYIKIHDLMGKLLVTHTIQHQGGVITSDLDLSSLTPGVYLIEWINANGVRLTKKMIKQ